MAHARRKFHELWANHDSKVGERRCGTSSCCSRSRRSSANFRQTSGDEFASASRVEWPRCSTNGFSCRGQQVPPGLATIKAIDYSLKRWPALTRYIEDGHVPISNNWVESQPRPIALARGNWLFSGSLRAGKRAAAVMSLVHSARINGHDPYAYLKDVLERLPTHSASRIDDLLPHRWQTASTTH
ncbi:transposase [Variovorax sp. OK202]|uniref:IS66 family transposase n=1 Tax=unclassified Variovorax TaxID=663243 RepID=UPI003528ECFA